jgi:MFS family permease
MVACGMISDKLVTDSSRRSMLAAFYCLGCGALVASALSLPAGTGQLVLLGAAMFLAGSTAGPAGAMVANLTPAALHGTAFAVLTLANNAFGLAPGPIVTGWLADRIGLLGAMQWLPLASLCAAIVFVAASRHTNSEVATATTA